MQGRTRIQPSESRHRVADPKPDGGAPRAPAGDGRCHEHSVLTRTIGEVEEDEPQPNAAPASVALEAGSSGTHRRRRPEAHARVGGRAAGDPQPSDNAIALNDERRRRCERRHRAEQDGEDGENDEAHTHQASGKAEATP